MGKLTSSWSAISQIVGRWERLLCFKLVPIEECCAQKDVNWIQQGFFSPSYAGWNSAHPSATLLIMTAEKVDFPSESNTPYPFLINLGHILEHPCTLSQPATTHTHITDSKQNSWWKCSRHVKMHQHILGQWYFTTVECHPSMLNLEFTNLVSEYSLFINYSHRAHRMIFNLVPSCNEQIKNKEFTTVFHIVWHIC